MGQNTINIGERKVKNVMEKENNILLDDSLRRMRIMEHPIQSDENLLIDDRLERGILRIYEYSGGSVYILGGMDEISQCSNAALVAEIRISIKDEKREVGIERIFSEFGYDYEHLLICQLINFADFYGYSPALLDLSKTNRKGA